MPRDVGTGLYHYPDGTPGNTGQTIFSARYNTFINDLANTLNQALPINMGGTGASDATTARTNLGAEAAGQVVTNYDSFPFENGSFSSDSGAVSAPIAGRYFVGHAQKLSSDPTQYVTLHAQTSDGILPSIAFTRQKVAGVWQPWVKLAVGATLGDGEGISADTGDMWFGIRGASPNSNFVVNTESDLTGANVFYVSKALSGNASLSGTAPGLNLNKTTDAGATILGQKNGSPRWAVQFANGAVESGGNVGSDFGIYRYGDSGAFLDNAATSLIITRSTGNAIFGYNLEARGTIVAHNDMVTSRADGVSGVLYFGTYASPRYFYCDGSQFFLVGGTTFNVQSSMAVTGNLNVTGNLALNGTITSGNEIAVSKAGAENSGISFVNSLRNWYTFCASDGHYWIYDQNGTRNYLNIDPTAGIVSIGGILDTGGYTISTNGTKCRAGLNGAQSNIYNIFWTGSSTQIWIDSSNQGTITVSSDYRIKKDVLDLPGTWETVKALRPIKYTLKDFTPPAEVKARAKQAAEDRQKGVEKPAPGPLIVGDDIERWGFIAHELQATLIADAATGEKDSPDTIQSPNPWTMIAALTKALQEAMARIEALEAAQATP